MYIVKISYIYICVCMKVMANKTNKSGGCLSEYSTVLNWFHYSDLVANKIRLNPSSHDIATKAD